MRTTERHRNEARFHDQQALLRAATFDQCPERLAFHDDEHLNHATWIRPAVTQLGNVCDRSILDLGCGHGMASVLFARRGARVVALDLSQGYLAEARRRAAANNVTVQFVHGSGEELPFADRSFDRVWGNAILHHLDLPAAADEIRRILTPEGVAVFAEPWDGNPLIRWARRRALRSTGGHTPDERPLRQRDVATLRKVFSSVDVQGFQLLSALRRVSKRRPTSALERLDAGLLRSLPFLRHFCRYVVLMLRR